MASPSAVRAGRAFVEIGGDESPLARALDRALAKVKAFGLSIAKIGIAITGLGTLPIGTLLTLAKFSAAAGDELNNLSIQTGLSVSELAALQSMAKLAGVDVQGVSSAFNNLNKEIVGLGSGVEGSISSFKKLGIQYKDLAGQTTYSQFIRVADAISRLGTPAERAAAALDIFGKSGAALLPVIEQGGKAIQEARKHFDNLGIAIGANAASSVAAFDDVIGEIVAQLAAVKNVIGAAAAEIFLPIGRAIQPILAYTIRWADANRTLVSQLLFVSAGVVTVGAVLTVAGVAIAAASVAIGGFASALGVVLSPVRLAFTATLGLGTSLFRVGAGVASISATTLTTLAGGLVSAAGAGLRLASIIPQLLLIGPILTVATSAAGFLGSALLTIGTTIAAAVPTVVGAVAGIAGTMISAVVGTFVAIYTPLLGFIAAIEIGISTALLGAVSAVAPAVGTFLLAITSQFGLLVPAIALIGAAIAPILIVKMLGGADKVKAALADFFGGIGSAIAGSFNGVVSTISGAFSRLAQYEVELFAKIPGIAAQAFGGLQSIGSSAVAGLRSVLSSLVETGKSVFASLASTAARAWAFIGSRASELSGVVKAVYSGIVAAFSSGQLELAGEIATNGLQLAWETLKSAAVAAWSTVVRHVLTTGATLASGVLQSWEVLNAGISDVLLDVAAFAQRTWIRIAATAQLAFEGSIDFVTRSLIAAQEKLGIITKEVADAQRRAADQITQQRRTEIEEDLQTSLGAVDTTRDAERAALQQQVEGRIREIKELEKSLLDKIGSGDTNGTNEIEARMKALREKLAALQKQIINTGDPNKSIFKIPDLSGVLGLADKLKASVAFGAVDINQVLRGVDPNKSQDRTAKATEATARNTATIVDKLDDALTIG